MSYFCVCKYNNLVIMLVFLVFFFGTSGAAGRESLLPELWSREDMVQVAGYGEEKLSTVLVTGTVLCHTCLDKESQNPSLPISGASVSVTCHASGKKRRSTLAQGITDENGDFIIDLPSELHAVPNLEKTCSVEVHQLPRNSLCQPGFVRKHRGIRLSSVGNGIRTYTARTISFMDPKSKPSPASMKKMAGKDEMSW